MNINNKIYNKNIFTKNNLFSGNTTNNIANDDNLSEESDNLSDELNKLIGNTNKSTKSDKYVKSTKSTKLTKSNDFNIINVYNRINELFTNNYLDCKIIGEIISFKISESNAWINIKSDDFQLLCIFWKITLNDDFNNLRLTKPGEKFIFEGKFNIMKKNLNIYLNIKSMIKFGKGDYLDIYDQYRIRIKDMGLGMPKKQLQIFPYNIGIITALGGAAIQDILQTLKLDKFIGKVIIKNALVQGSQCPKSLINSIFCFLVL